jgi:hypothetical protein
MAARALLAARWSYGMDNVDEDDGDGTTARSTQRRGSKLRMIVGVLAVWGVVAYFVAPLLWEAYAAHDRALDASPRITETGDHHPGDPLNVALVGTREQLDAIMFAAQWHPAASLGLKSDVEIAVDTVLSRPDVDAPVSSLFLFGRKEDAAFEQPVGDNPRHRHHVRFWKLDEPSQDGRPLWVGAAVYDAHVGLSRTTGQITHVTAADIDVERDYLFACLEKSGDLASRRVVEGFHTQREGRNGGGDPWRTDGDLDLGVIAPDAH